MLGHRESHQYVGDSGVSENGIYHHSMAIIWPFDRENVHGAHFIFFGIPSGKLSQLAMENHHL